MRSKSLRTMVVSAQNSCIIKNMHYDVMHYEQVNCTSSLEIFILNLDQER